jgi:uncharacterized protein YkwD
MPRTTWRIVVFAAVLAMLVAPASGSAGSRGAASRLQSALLGQVNALRTAQGLPRLRLSRGLSAAAKAHSSQMARLGYFSHDSANGSSFLQRLSRYYKTRGYRSWYAGENILWASPDVGAAQALRMWLESPPHRANLLSPRWREIGLGAAHSPRAPGVYGNRAATIVTADFGVRSR